eukprot:1572339-Rhodomonas_salina.1
MSTTNTPAEDPGYASEGEIPRGRGILRTPGSQVNVRRGTQEGPTPMEGRQIEVDGNTINLDDPRSVRRLTD